MFCKQHTNKVKRFIIALYSYKVILLGVLLTATLVLLYVNLVTVLYQNSNYQKHSTAAKNNLLKTADIVSKLENYLTTQDAVSTILMKPSERIKVLSQCYDRPAYQKVQQRGKFFVFSNFIKSNKVWKCSESITMTTQADFTFLDNLIPLVERWKGPISIALYAPGDDFYHTLDSIAYLRNCETKLIKKYVTFHLFLPNDHLPSQRMAVPLIDIYNDKINCTILPPYVLVNRNDTYKFRKTLTYPINVARNIAREAVQTHFVFASDIELYPTRNFIPKFFHMLIHNDSYWSDQLKVFVLPIYEVQANYTVPETKTELKELVELGVANLFHETICLKCHAVVKYQEWILENETEGLNVFSVGKRQGFHRIWEPFYIGTHTDPLFNERLTWEGQSNKMSQGYTLCLLDYEYMVLDNAFLVHKPGVKKTKVQVDIYKDIVEETNKIMKPMIKEELNLMYGFRDGCKL